MKTLLGSLSRLFRSTDDIRAQADVFIAQGHLLEDEKQPEAALERYHAAVRLAPDYPRAHLNAGNALLALARLDEAVAYYRAAIRLDPSYAHAYFNLGRALNQAKRLEEAIVAYREALRCDPVLAEAHVALGAAYEEQENTSLAMQSYQEALSIRPDFAEVHYNLGRLYAQERQLDSAVDELRQALQFRPDYPDALEKLASTYIKIGFAREAVEQLRLARQLEPEHYAHYSHYLLNMNYLADFSDAEVFAEHYAYGEKFGCSLPSQASYPNVPNPERRLRIGYVSGDFRQHPVLRFIEPLLEKHHRDQVEVFCYNTLDKPDAVTERLKTLADQWRETLGLDDDSVAQLIRADQIDILIDLSGHTGFQRLAVFALRPAPVQATWLGYLGTTGLKEMDYRICDNYTDPPGLTEQYHSERLARLPDCQWCYRPPFDLPSPTPLPLSKNGYITFASFNNIAKLNDQVLELWAQVLLAIPDSRLLIAAMPDSVLAEKRIIDVFSGYGIASERLDFRARQPSLEYYRTCLEADIALDPFPYNGGTTSIDILCLGIPFITLAGTRSIARGGVTLLSNLGLTQFIAYSKREYIHIAQHWAAQPDALAALRTALPGQVTASPLVNEARFVNQMEQLFRDMWKTWLDEQQT